MDGHHRHAFLETVGDVAGKLAKTPATTLVQAALLLAAKVTEKSTPLAAEVKAAKPQDGIHDSFIALYRELQVQGKLPKDFPAIERKDVDSLFDHLKQIPSSSRPNESPALVTQLTGWLEVDTKEHGRSDYSAAKRTLRSHPARAAWTSISSGKFVSR